MLDRFQRHAAAARQLGRRVGPLAVALVLAAHGPSEAASPDDASAAVDELNRAADALEDKDYDQAVARLRRVLSMVESGELRWRALGGLAFAFGEQGRLVSAEHWWRRFLEATRTAEDAQWRTQRERALARLAQVRSRLMRSHGVVIVTTTPAAAEIRVQPPPSEEPPEGARRLYLVAGDHELIVSAGGFVTRRVPLRVASGVELPPLHVQLEREPEPQPSLPPPNTGPSALAIGGYATASVGVAALIVGGVLWALAADDREAAAAIPDPAPPDQVAEYERLVERLEQRRPAAYALVGIGGAALLTGIGLLVADAVMPDVAVDARPDSVTLTLGGRF